MEADLYWKFAMPCRLKGICGTANGSWRGGGYPYVVRGGHRELRSLEFAFAAVRHDMCRPGYGYRCADKLREIAFCVGYADGGKKRSFFVTQNKETPHRVDFVVDDVRYDSAHDNGFVVEKHIVQLIGRRLDRVGIISSAQLLGRCHESPLPVVGVDSDVSVDSDVIADFQRNAVCGSYIAVPCIIEYGI